MIIMGGDKKKLAAVVVGTALKKEPKESEVEPKETKEEEDYEESLLYAANDIMKSIESKDVIKLRECLKAFFEICDSMPHEEGEHIG